jgi:hypothetical protein
LEKIGGYYFGCYGRLRFLEPRKSESKIEINSVFRILNNEEAPKRYDRLLSGSFIRSLPGVVNFQFESALIFERALEVIKLLV